MDNEKATQLKKEWEDFRYFIEEEYENMDEPTLDLERFKALCTETVMFLSAYAGDEAKIDKAALRLLFTIHTIALRAPMFGDVQEACGIIAEGIILMTSDEGYWPTTSTFQSGQWEDTLHTDEIIIDPYIYEGDGGYINLNEFEADFQKLVDDIKQYWQRRRQS